MTRVIKIPERTKGECQSELADLLTAFAILCPETESSRRAIAELLGLYWRGGMKIEPKRSTSADKTNTADGDASESTLTESSGSFDGDIRENETAEGAGPIRAKGKEPAQFPFAARPNEAEREVEPSDFWRFPPKLQERERETSDYDEVSPRWLPDQPLPQSKSMIARKARPREPLLHPRRIRPLLLECLSTTAADGPVDVGSLRDQLSKGQLVTFLPRLKRRSLAHGVEIIVDRSRALTPFFGDQDALVLEVVRLFGEESTHVSYFKMDVRNGAGPGAEQTWRSWTPHSSECPVFLLTDLGILERRNVFVYTAQSWLELISIAERSGNSVTAFVPYEPKHWPVELVNRFSIFHWDRKLSLREIRQENPHSWQVYG